MWSVWGMTKKGALENPLPSYIWSKVEKQLDKMSVV